MSRISLKSILFLIINWRALRKVTSHRGYQIRRSPDWNMEKSVSMEKEHFFKDIKWLKRVIIFWPELPFNRKCSRSSPSIYYEKLLDLYKTPENCSKMLRQRFCQSWTVKFNEALIKDKDCKLAVYKTLNPELISPNTDNIPEFERLSITRYRCGSHYLAIEKGRFQNKKREFRLCLCGAVQTMEHVVFDCPLIDKLPNITSLKEFFQLESQVISSFLSKCEKTLKIRCMK